ncbi:hypothetical protein KC330_g8619, partial [Hortaea werneckii]
MDPNTNNIFAGAMDVSEGEQDDTPITPNPSTSKKRMRKTSKEVTDDNEGDFEDNNDDSAEDATPKKKAKPTPKTPGSKGTKSGTPKK